MPRLAALLTIVSLALSACASPAPRSPPYFSVSSFLRKQGKTAADGVRVQLDHWKEQIHHSDKQKDGKVGAWSVHTHEAFPGKSMRIKETEGLCDPDVKQYVGYLDVEGKNDDKHFFFWFFESRRNPAKDPLILWLNGGPGCSSLTGLFMELGPCRVNPNGNGTTLNKWSWNNEANIVFLDQPINVGFSYADNEEVSNTVDAAADVYAFLQLFLQNHSKYSKLDLHITGESYAGHYVPAIGTAIAEGNQDAGDDGIVELKLKSLAIGNGLTDPLVQYKYYPDMACDTKYGPVLDEATCEDMRGKYGTCKSLISSCYKWKSAFSCVPGAIYCNNAMIGPFQSTGLNIYDIREKCDTSKNPLCYEILGDIETYLNTADVQEALGVDRQYEGCKRDINMKFMMAGDWMRPYVEDLIPLLEDGVKVLIYAGDADFICNWIGNKAWTLELEWSGKSGFNDAKDLPWISKNTKKEAGEFRTYKSLTFLKVYEAGHMVPYDQPEHSSEFINNWISNKN
ncbi:hypothetical protein HK104_007297 [Borealophlyctis nickersoniae]|nr:hypothetical protein HK104_007297 [Borealophlyctis nickersoniae]